MNKETVISAYSDEYLEVTTEDPPVQVVKLTEAQENANILRVLCELEQNPGGGD